MDLRGRHGHEVLGGSVMLSYDHDLADQRTARSTSAAPSRSLTPREHQIALLVAKGFKNVAIARQLTLSPATVATYVRRIQARLKLSGRRQIEVWVTERPTAGHRDILPE